MMTFERYHTCDEIDAQLKSWAQEYPDIFRLESIGETLQGRNILAVTLTRADDTAENKPGFLLTGGLHAGEVAGSEAVMYALKQLLGPSRELLKGRTVYAIPVINADGRRYYQETPYHNVRGSVRDYFDEEDGVYEADADGDGEIVTMRSVDPAGKWKASPFDDRLIVAREPDDTEGPFYRVWWEGFVHGENTLTPNQAAPRKWLDPNRAFPFGWDEKTMGPYGHPVSGPKPLFEPEVRAAANFVCSHGNIAAGNDMHTHAGLHISPLDFCPECDAPYQDAMLFAEIGAGGAKKSGYGRDAIFPAGLTGMAKGSFTGWLYFEKGIAAWCTEMYSTHLMSQEMDKMPDTYHPLYPTLLQQQQDEAALLRWDDTHGSQSFVPWRKFEHPQLGNVELGGWRSKYIIDNPPPSHLEEDCARAWGFTRCALLAMPCLDIPVVRLTQNDGSCLIEAVVANTGRQPTSGTTMAQRSCGGTSLQVSLLTPERVVGSYECELDGFDSRRFAWTVPDIPGKIYELHVSGSRSGKIVRHITL